MNMLPVETGSFLLPQSPSPHTSQDWSFVLGGEREQLEAMVTDLQAAFPSPDPAPEGIHGDCSSLVTSLVHRIT